MSLKPNIILIFTDNQQAQTLGCYGNAEVHTPHLDQLAREGLQFNRAFCPNAYCSPCRASLMTGLMPSQHGVHAWIDDRNMDEWPSGWHALSGLPTLPEMLQKQGYQTGIFGKYHLGDPTSPAPGWDAWVTMADGHVRSFYDNRISDNGATYQHAGHSVDFFTDKAIAFMKAATAPYLAYIPLPAPYGHWPATNDGKRNRHAARYDDCPMLSVPRMGLRVSTVRNYDMIKEGSGKGLDFSMILRAANDLPTLRNYYSQITMIDDAVGRLRAADPEALIIFTTDHGMSLGHHGFWGHGGATYPSNMHLAAHSIPLIAAHAGHIPPRAPTGAMISGTDLFATLLDYIGAPPEGAPASRSYAALLKGEEGPDPGADEVYAEQEETRVIRTPHFVLFKRFNRPGAPTLGDALYDVQADPGETINLAADPVYAEVLQDLRARIDRFFAQHARPEADMWRGGRPVQNSMMQRYWRDIWGPDWGPVYGYGEPR
ncbi:MAG: sulfatase-like hydrolase/transferase [Pseudomonadota bacterium]